MLFLPTAWTYETGLPPETGIPGFWESTVPIAVEQERIQFIPSHPSMGQRNRFQLQGAIQAPSVAQMGQRGQSLCRGQAQSSQVRTSGT